MAARRRAEGRAGRRGRTSPWPSPPADDTLRTGTFIACDLLLSLRLDVGVLTHLFPDADVCVLCVSQPGDVVPKSQQNPGESGGHPAARRTNHYGEVSHHPPVPHQGKPTEQNKNHIHAGQCDIKIVILSVTQHCITISLLPVGV